MPADDKQFKAHEVKIMSRELKKYFIVLGLENEVIENITVRDAIVAFQKAALKKHPNKAGADYTVAFQEISESYQRVLKYLIDKLKASEFTFNVNINEDEDSRAFSRSENRGNAPNSEQMGNLLLKCSEL